MFSQKPKNAMDYTNEQNRIAKGTKIIGDIITEGSLRIEGEIKGKVEAKAKVVVAKTAIVDGEIHCDYADIEGKTKGLIITNSVLNIKKSAEIYGQVITGKLVVEAGAQFNASCKMKASVKSIKDAQRKAESEQKALQA